MRPPLLHLGNLPRAFFWINVFLAGLNLLPAYPLDGGRVLRTFFASRMGTIAATRRAINLGNLFVVLLMFAGLWNTWFMLAGFFLFVGSQLEERTALFQSVLESLRMEEIMLTDFCTLSPADTLEDAISKAVHTLQDDFPVVRGNEMVGVVTRQKILEALRHEGNAYVQSVMNKAYEVAGRQEAERDADQGAERRAHQRQEDRLDHLAERQHQRRARRPGPAYAGDLGPRGVVPSRYRGRQEQVAPSGAFPQDRA